MKNTVIIILAIFIIIESIFLKVVLNQNKKLQETTTNVNNIYQEYSTASESISITNSVTTNTEKVEQTEQQTINTTEVNIEQSKDKVIDLEKKMISIKDFFENISEISLISLSLKNKKDTTYLVLEFTYTNKTDIAREFAFNHTMEAFQNGIQLQENILNIDENEYKKIQENTTITIRKYFETNDVTSNIELEISSLGGTQTRETIKIN